MDCSQAQEAIQLELDGELSPQMRQELTGHLAGCSDCRSVSRQHQAIRGAMTRLAAVPLEIDASAPRSAPCVEADTHPCASRGGQRRRAWRPLLAAAAVVALCVCGWQIAWQMHGRSNRQTDVAAGSKGSQPAPAGGGLAASEMAPQVAAANSDPRSAVRVEFDPATDVIALPKPTKNPNVTVLWIYPAVRTASAPPRSSIESDSNQEGVQL